jgi:hypothetical protein
MVVLWIGFGLALRSVPWYWFAQEAKKKRRRAPHLLVWSISPHNTYAAAAFCHTPTAPTFPNPRPRLLSLPAP